MGGILDRHEKGLPKAKSRSLAEPEITVDSAGPIHDLGLLEVINNKDSCTQNLPANQRSVVLGQTLQGASEGGKCIQKFGGGGSPVSFSKEERNQS